MLPFTKIIHEDLSVILTFAYSHNALQKMLTETFKGEWKYLRKTTDEIGPERAIRACLELANILRALDDAEGISSYQQTRKAPAMGRVLKDGGLEEPLFLRDLTNKIVHAKQVGFDLSSVSDPKLVCVGHDPKRWVAAEISIQSLAAFCGQLMH